MNKEKWYKTFEELKEELGDEFEDYMYKANIELLNKLDKIKELINHYAVENDIKLLQEENKKLKDLCDKYEEEHNTTFIEWQKDINIIKNLDKMFEYYFLGNLKYDQDTVNTIYIKYVKLKELNIEEK